MLCREIIAVCSEIYTKHINTLCGQNEEFCNVKPGGTFGDQWNLNDYSNQLHPPALNSDCLKPDVFNTSRFINGYSSLLTNRTAHIPKTYILYYVPWIINEINVTLRLECVGLQTAPQLRAEQPARSNYTKII